MTENKMSPPRGFFMNAERCGRGMRISVGAVISISEFSHKAILLVSHSGKIKIIGEGLSLSVFEGRGVEILGRVKEVLFFYGKN